MDKNTLIKLKSMYEELIENRNCMLEANKYKKIGEIVLGGQIDGLKVAIMTIENLLNEME